MFDYMPQVTPETCVICYLTDSATAPCVMCQKFCCVNCSIQAIQIDPKGGLLSSVVPDFVAVMCSNCNPPQGGRPSLRRHTPSPSPNGVRCLIDEVVFS